MVSSYKHKNIAWIDLESPTVDEVKDLMRKYGVTPSIADELLRPTARPRVDAYSNLVYLILHFPVYDISRKASAPCEIDFIVGKNFIITAHYASIIPLHELIKAFEVGMLMSAGKQLAKDGAGRIMFLVVKHLYEFALRQLEHVHAKITEIEDHIFKGLEKEMVREISLVQRDVLEFRRSIHAHGSILKTMEEMDGKTFGPDFHHYIRGMLSELSRVENTLENTKETIESLRETNDSLLSNRTNEIMKKLTSAALITFPVMFVLAIFSLSVSSFPMSDFAGAFWVVIFLALLAATGAFFLLKKKDLL